MVDRESRHSAGQQLLELDWRKTSNDSRREQDDGNVCAHAAPVARLSSPDGLRVR